ncbi:MAG: hypothetical protein R3C44_09390 [Chloroflexota bacterium]
MRFIIHQQRYEKPIAAGQLRYERDGQPTGAVEQFRMTAAVDGYRFLRVDLDAQQAPSRRSTLYHMTLNPDGRPEQLKYRFWGDGLEISGTVVWETEQLTALRTVNGTDYEEESNASAFWFPSAAGLSLLRPLAGADEPTSAVTLNQDTAVPEQAMALYRTEVSVQENEPYTFFVTGESYDACGYEIRWDEQARRVWLHENGWPLKVWRDDGLSAISTQLVIY